MELLGVVTIFGRVPSLNEVIEANRRNPYAGAELKRRTEAWIGYYIRQSVNRGACPAKITEPAAVHIAFTEKNRRRDLDNIYSGNKFILDAMQRTGLIEGDSQKHIRALWDTFSVGDAERITVRIYRADGSENGMPLLPDDGGTDT